MKKGKRELKTLAVSLHPHLPQPFDAFIDRWVGGEKIEERI